MSTQATWKPRPSEIPDLPGVYMFKDTHQRVLYVGKAASLKNRVPTYFRAGGSARTEAMVDVASGVEWIVTSNEVEALQLEVSLIKEHLPRYNVRYRDDKSYPYLAVTLSEDFPRPMVVRGRKRKGNRYFGPYAHAYAIRETLDLLLRVFPVRSCSPGVFKRANKTGRPCLLFHIGRCSAPCVGKVSPEEHREIVDRFCRFLDGEREPVIKGLETDMSKASDRLEYEQAARIRDQLSSVRKAIERQEMVTERPENLDAIAWSGDDLEAAFQAFFVRGGRVVGRKGFIVDRVEELTDAQLMASFLETLYSDDQEVPREVLVPVKPTDQNVVEAWLQANRDGPVTIRVPKRGSKRKLLETVTDNARQSFARSRLKRASDFAARSRALEDLQTHLGLEEAPLRIECFDISNLGPTEVVGSMVVFEDGLPKKSDYRKFRIRSTEGQDDVGSMGEMINRRFQRFMEQKESPKDRKNRFAYRPSLVVVDGGKGQLNRTVEVLGELGIVDVAVVALAKKFEELFVPGESDPIRIPRGSEALYLLQRIRDEAHRVAITFQRQRRRKRLTQSVLDTLPGVGKARRQALLTRFGSAAAVKKASREQISQVPGIGEGLARRIYDELHNGSGGEA